MEQAQIRIKLRELEAIMVRRQGTLTTRMIPYRFEYQDLRRQLMTQSIIAVHIKKLIGDFENLLDWYGYRKREFSDNGRAYVGKCIDEMLTVCEESSPSEESLSDTFQSLDAPRVREAWYKALGHVELEPDAAITAARSMLESTCKKILVDRLVEFDTSADLSSLFKKAATVVGLSSGESATQSFRQLSGGCLTIVNAVASIRNELGDAHGREDSAKAPMQHDALFVVTVAGATAQFLLHLHHRMSP